MTVATVIELVASFALPVIVIAAGHPDWVLPSIAITIGPLLLWLDHLVHIPRYRPVGWALTIGPVILVATLSGTASPPPRARRRCPPARHRRRRLPRPRRRPIRPSGKHANPVTNAEVDDPTDRYRPFVNPATSEHIQYMAAAEDSPAGSASEHDRRAVDYVDWFDHRRLQTRAQPRKITHVTAGPVDATTPDGAQRGMLVRSNHSETSPSAWRLSRARCCWPHGHVD